MGVKHTACGLKPAHCGVLHGPLDEFQKWRNAQTQTENVWHVVWVCCLTWWCRRGWCFRCRQKSPERPLWCPCPATGGLWETAAGRLTPLLYETDPGSTRHRHNLTLDPSNCCHSSHSQVCRPSWEERNTTLYWTSPTWEMRDKAMIWYEAMQPKFMHIQQRFLLLKFKFSKNHGWWLTWIICYFDFDIFHYTKSK